MESSERPAVPETPRRIDIVPPTVQLAYLTSFGLVLASYFFVVFCVARGLLRGVGFGISESVQCFGISLVMAGFIVWLAPLSQLMELWYQHRVPARRAQRGLCPGCGHGFAADAGNPSEPSVARCPECGSDRSLRSPLQFGWETLRRFGIVLGAAYLVGCGAAMAWLHLDERAFARECAVARILPHARPRVWPASFATLHFDGVAATSSSVTEPDVQPLVRPSPAATPTNEQGPRSGERGP